jgi:hypothetical protein
VLGKEIHDPAPHLFTLMCVFQCCMRIFDLFGINDIAFQVNQGSGIFVGKFGMALH